ncbi:MAG: acyl-CoA thioesterase [Minwuiales bacterium]|nr:acyl-CoA thioesterase [Minwuiales bacterium]
MTVRKGKVTAVQAHWEKLEEKVMTFVAERLAATRQRMINASKIEEADARRDEPQPRGELTIRTWALPTNTNPFGSIFGGWIMSQMDAAGAIAAENVVQGPVVTLAVDRMTLFRPIKVGDVVCCYTDLEKIGRTSLCLNVEVWTSRQERPRKVKVTEGRLTFVAVDAEGLPQLIRSAGQDCTVIEQECPVIESRPGSISVPCDTRRAANDHDTGIWRPATKSPEPLPNT